MLIKLVLLGMRLVLVLLFLVLLGLIMLGLLLLGILFIMPVITLELHIDSTGPFPFALSPFDRTGAPWRVIGE